MTDDLLQQKRALENKIAECIIQKLTEFNRVTDLSVSDIHINMVEVTGLSDKYPQFVMGAVNVTISEKET